MVPADRPHVQTIAPIAFKFSTVLQYFNISRRFFSFIEIPNNPCFLIILRNTQKIFLNATYGSTSRPNPCSDCLHICYSALIRKYFLAMFYFFLIPKNSHFSMIFRNTLNIFFNAKCVSTPRPNHYSDWFKFLYSAFIH